MKKNINKLICFTSLRKMLLVLCLSLFVISCKKELFVPAQRKVQTTSKIQTIKYAEFIDAVNTSGLSGLNELLAPANHEQGGKKMTKANVAERQFKIDMNAVKKLVLGDTISYVVSLMPSSPHAVHFHNLTVQKIKNTSIAFLTTYTPNKEWIENWKSGRKLAFSGTLTFSDIDTKKIDLTASRSAKIEPASNQVFMDAGSGKEKSKGIDNSISLAPGDCEFYDIYEFVPYTCSSGDWPGYCIWETDISSMGQLEHLPGYRVEKTTVLNCAPPDRPGSSSDGEGGGGGGGATTPTPPSDYDPCFGGSETIWYDNVYGGLKLAIAAVNPCDGGETGQNPIPTNPATEAIQSLIAYLPITDYSQQQYLKNNTNLAVAINNYLNTNGWTPDNKEFASWGIGYLMGNSYIDINTFLLTFFPSGPALIADPNADNWTDLDNEVLTDPDQTVYQQYQDSQPWPTIGRVIGYEKFVPIRRRNDDPDKYVNCLILAKEQLGKVGYTSSGYLPSLQTFSIYTSQSGVNLNETKMAISYMISSLSQKIPILIGVDNRAGAPKVNRDNSTDHFVVVVGMGTDTNGKYFQFFDSATDNPSTGASYNNRLYYSSSTGKITGKTSITQYRNQQGMHDYIVTQVRKSIKK